jgi:hypothetical protein
VMDAAKSSARAAGKDIMDLSVGSSDRESQSASSGLEPTASCINLPPRTAHAVAAIHLSRNVPSKCISTLCACCSGATPRGTRGSAGEPSGNSVCACNTCCEQIISARSCMLVQNEGGTYAAVALWSDVSNPGAKRP